MYVAPFMPLENYQHWSCLEVSNVFTSLANGAVLSETCHELFSRELRVKDEFCEITLSISEDNVVLTKHLNVIDCKRLKTRRIKDCQ